MTSEEIKQIVKALKEEQVKVQDMGNASANITVSQLMRDVNSNIQDIRNDVMAIKESVQPAVDAISASKTVATFIKWLAGTIIALGAIWVFTKEVIKVAIRQ